MLNLMSPVREQQPFIWLAQYNDGSTLYEFESETKENLFDSINRDKLEKFGLVGEELDLHFKIDDGIFYVFNQQLGFCIEEKNNNIISLSNRNIKYNDIITYKSFYQDYSPDFKNKSNIVIDGYFFGYKTNIIDSDRNIHFKNIMVIPMGKEVKFKFRVVSNTEINGMFHIYSFKTIIKSIDINIPINTAVDIEYVLTI